MDGMSVLIIIAIAAVLVMVVSLVILRADARRTRRERERHDISEVEHQPDSNLRPAPLSNREPGIVIGSGTESSRLPTPATLQPLRPPDPRIIFGSPEPTGQGQRNSSALETGGIRFGSASQTQETRKCPLCTQLINTGEAVLECEQCHTRFHRIPCWEEHNREGKQFCPQCSNAHIVSLTA